MSMVFTKVKPKSASIYAVVTRTDGSEENKGLVAYYHKNPVINWLVNTYIKSKDLFK